jgi:hypothetical protein
MIEWPKLRRTEYLDPEWVRYGKQKLHDAGYFHGDISDGEFTDDLEDAIKRFDADHGVNSEVGALDRATWEMLAIKVGD